MSSLKTIEKSYLEDLLQMRGGYVLYFTNSTFADCILEATNIDIYDPKYAVNGTSKACRLRLFWDIETDATVVKVLSSMLEILEYKDEMEGKPSDATRYERLKNIIARLSPKPISDLVSESDFLQKDYGKFSLQGLPADPTIIPILQYRIDEAERSRQSGSPLSLIFMCGSILEGVLLGAAINDPKRFNQSLSSPKDKDGKVKGFQDWTLCQFIDTAFEIGLIGLDVKKFSHSLRDFRNYIHPYQQLASRFEPTRHTAEICYQVMKACIACLKEKGGQ